MCSTWKTEHEVYRSMARSGFDVFGDLIDAYKQRNEESVRSKLDALNTNIDKLGTMLDLNATMMTGD